MVKLIKDLLFEKRKLSLSRVFLIIIFILSLILWSTGLDLPGSMLTIFLTLLGYAFGQKFINNGDIAE